MGLRIAYVINSLEGGGAAQPVPAITGLLCDRGATVRVLALSMRNGKARPALVAAGIDHRVGPGHKDQHARAFRWLIRELRGFQPDLIWTSLTQATVMGQIAGRLLSVPVVSWQHNAFLKPANLRLLRMTRSWSRLWVADSANVAALTRQRLGLDPADTDDRQFGEQLQQDRRQHADRRRQQRHRRRGHGRHRHQYRERHRRPRRQLQRHRRRGRFLDQHGQPNPHLHPQCHRRRR